MLTSIAGLACTWKYRVEVEEAINLMEECIQLQRYLLGADHHPDTVSLSTPLIS
jgi:hypothetical protein